MANDPTFANGVHAGSMTLVKADLGTKRNCPSCGARFYDLQKRPIECPKCAFAFEPEALYKQRRPRQPEPEPSQPEREEAEEETAETEDAELEEEGIEEEPVLVADEEEGDEPAQAEEETSAESGMSVVEGDEADMADIEDIDEEGIEEENADETILEEVEEENDDVSGIIDTDIEKDERRWDVGAIAQLGERLNGIQEVRGSTPLGSTNLRGEAGKVFHRSFNEGGPDADYFVAARERFADLIARHRFSR